MNTYTNMDPTSPLSKLIQIANTTDKKNEILKWIKNYILEVESEGYVSKQLDAHPGATEYIEHFKAETARKIGHEMYDKHLLKYYEMQTLQNRKISWHVLVVKPNINAIELELKDEI